MLADRIQKMDGWLEFNGILSTQVAAIQRIQSLKN